MKQMKSNSYSNVVFEIKKSKSLLLLILLIFHGAGLFAGEGPNHSHGNEMPSINPTVKYFSIEANSDKYEMLLRYKTILPNETVELTLFVSEFNTNKPIDKAIIKISAQEDSKIEFEVKQVGEGTYAIEAIFPEDKPYSLAISIESPIGPDLLLLSKVEIGKELPGLEKPHEHSLLDHGKTALFLILSLLIGWVLGSIFQKRKSSIRQSNVSIILFVACTILPVQNNIAHGDDDHGAKKLGNNFSNSFEVPKETQFLFEVYTQKIEAGSFSESTKLFGTIIPGSKGQAKISTAQSGIIKSLRIHVGERVRAGQLLAVIQQNLDAGTQLNLLTEKNKLSAEYDAAKKEKERLHLIQDIAAKKDIDEAIARFQKAESNLNLLKSNTAKEFVLKAPIEGLISNFNLSVGSTVTAGQELFSITDLSQIYAEAQVFDKDATKVQNGNKFTIECSNDSHKTSEVKLLSFTQEMNATNQSQRVLFELNNPGDDFKIGEFVNIRVFSPKNSQKITLPNAAITEINGKPVVFVKDAAENFTLRYVQIGENNGSFTSINKGIEESERIVINATYQLKMIYLNQ